MKTVALSSLLLSLSLPLAGCGSDDGGGSGDGLDPVPSAPTETAQVAAAYDDLGNSCNEGWVTRGMTPIFERDPRILPWTTPDADPGAMVGFKHQDGWTTAVVPGEVTFESVAGEMSTRSPEQAARCGAAEELITPAGAQDELEHFATVLLYAGEHEHFAYENGPGSGQAPRQAPVRMRGYIDVTAAKEIDDELPPILEIKSVQHLPISVSCDSPLTIKATYRGVTLEGSRGLDGATCRSQNSSEYPFMCVAEVAELPANATCTFVATDVAYTTYAGENVRMSLGGTITPRDGEAGKYRIRLDRFAFHAAQ